MKSALREFFHLDAVLYRYEFMQSLPETGLSFLCFFREDLHSVMICPLLDACSLKILAHRTISIQLLQSENRLIRGHDP